ncbi:MAG: ferritin-like protein [Chloroflexi bacterium]|nr:ferritin-like protein [Chloroflexota bacterium]
MVAVRIENRAQLVYLLTEAAELEHEILCCYLFCTFTMKDSTAEGLTEAQLEAVRGWRRAINGVAVQEMIHLATACNLLTAVGGAPQLRRPNLPTSSRAYPPAFRLQLIPFGLAALDEFIQLERPEALAAAPGGYRAGAVSLDRLGDIFSSERNYETVGELYRGIQDGFSYLAQKLGEDRLFVGPAEAQTADPYFTMPGLIPVRDLASALAAINVIVEQGEGASPDSEHSHYNRFVAIRREYDALLAADPAFEPARPVVANPCTVMPADHALDSLMNRIDDPFSADFCNLVDGSYELMVQVLARMFVHAEESAADLALLSDMTVGMMMDVVQPLGNALTLLAAGPSLPGKNAGPSFRLSRGAAIPTHRSSAWPVFRERLSELASYCRFLQAGGGTPPVLAQVRSVLEGFAARFADGEAVAS